MSVSFEFYAGNADAIGRAFTEIEFDGLRDGTIAHSYADLSLHLSPSDFDILSEQAAGITGRMPIRLLDSLERHVGGTEDESSADVVSRAWVEAIASVPADRAAELSALWLSAVMCETGEEIDTASPDAASRVEVLLRLCRDALLRDTEVVFAWYL